VIWFGEGVAWVYGEGWMERLIYEVLFEGVEKKVKEEKE
jgi:hypothetical protein